MATGIPDTPTANPFQPNIHRKLRKGGEKIVKTRDQIVCRDSVFSSCRAAVPRESRKYDFLNKT